MEEVDRVIQGETITAAGDLDKNTAGGTTKEGPNPHTHRKQAGCQHVVIRWQLTRNHANNMRRTVIRVLASMNFEKYNQAQDLD